MFIKIVDSRNNPIISNPKFIISIQKEFCGSIIYLNNGKNTSKTISR